MFAELKYVNDHSLLIIDDEVEITKSLVRQFRKKYKVFTTTNAEDGFKILEKENVQVILSDQRMPGMTGVEFFTKIKDKYPEVLKLIITGFSDVEAVIGAINDGQVFRYVTKPWNPVELDSILNEAFEKSDLISQNRELMHNLRELNRCLEEKVVARTLELEKLNVKLSELNVEKNRYIGMVVHDLRDPISTAISFSELMMECNETINSETRLKYLKYIYDNCTFSISLIHDFLDISKIEAGVFDLKCTVQEYRSFVYDSIVQNEILAKNKLQEIRVIAARNTMMVCFDKNKLKLVLDNLLSNAIKYSYPNTKIIIDISQSNTDIVTKIVDHGLGIPADELSKLFNPFQTASVKPTADEKSTGLGLAIVKKIVEAHQGTISVESVVGQGSTFSFTLPLNIIPNA
jgi:signal transduction histidine kinase